MPQLLKRMPGACSEWCHGFRQDLQNVDVGGVGVGVVAVLSLLLTLVSYGYVRRPEPAGVAIPSLTYVPPTACRGGISFLSTNDPSCPSYVVMHQQSTAVHIIPRERTSKTAINKNQNTTRYSIAAAVENQINLRSTGGGGIPQISRAAP